MTSLRVWLKPKIGLARGGMDPWDLGVGEEKLFYSQGQR